ncbi:protein of unknown function (plasmid) [Cupriavidus taiwanensis]|uniref:Uncharacterized protein n=1 Tax=Cupriavidus taiwanensis TaxID=164546 RepID=A0A375ISR9_9BURK|nr:protein of unknown function [Cupriavidus taiwanensis]
MKVQVHRRDRLEGLTAWKCNLNVFVFFIVWVGNGLDDRASQRVDYPILFVRLQQSRHELRQLRKRIDIALTFCSHS